MLVFFSHLQNTTVDTMTDTVVSKWHQNTYAVRKKMLVLKHASSAITLDHIPCGCFLAPLAVVSAHTRQRSTSCWMPVTLMTTTSSSNRRNKMKVRCTRSSTTALNDTQSAKCASSLHPLASPSYHVDILGSVPVVPRLYQQWTAAVPYAVLQSRRFCACSIISCNIGKYTKKAELPQR